MLLFAISIHPKRTTYSLVSVLVSLAPKALLATGQPGMLLAIGPLGKVFARRELPPHGLVVAPFMSHIARRDKFPGSFGLIIQSVESVGLSGSRPAAPLRAFLDRAMKPGTLAGACQCHLER